MRKLRKSGKEVVQKGQLKDTQTEANWSDGDDDEGDVWDANVEDNKSCHEMSGDGSELDEKGVCDHGTCSRCGNTGGVRIRVYRVTSKDG